VSSTYDADKNNEMKHSAVADASLHASLFILQYTNSLPILYCGFLHLIGVSFWSYLQKKKDDETPVEGALTPYPGLARFLTL
jgi:hypothetical protein